MAKLGSTGLGSSSRWLYTSGVWTSRAEWLGCRPHPSGNPMLKHDSSPRQACIPDMRYKASSKCNVFEWDGLGEQRGLRTYFQVRVYQCITFVYRNLPNQLSSNFHRSTVIGKAECTDFTRKRSRTGRGTQISCIVRTHNLCHTNTLICRKLSTLIGLSNQPRT